MQDKRSLRYQMYANVTNSYNINHNYVQLQHPFYDRVSPLCTKKMLGHSIMWCLCLQHTHHPTNLQSTQHHLHNLHQNQLRITKVCLVCPISPHFVALWQSPLSLTGLHIKQNQLVDIPTNIASTTKQNASSHSPTPLPSVDQCSTLCRP